MEPKVSVIYSRETAIGLSSDKWEVKINLKYMDSAVNAEPKVSVIYSRETAIGLSSDKWESENQFEIYGFSCKC
jgi:hypothetical protein